jgi:TRAP-type C4-dicarboxylate transport system substrate-binding protein
LIALATALALLTGVSTPVAAPAQSKAAIKLATLVPEGSIWDKAFRTMTERWTKETEGRVKVRIYPGGMAGDEPGILRKMRTGSLNAAALTVSGLSDIDQGFAVFEIPMFFRSKDEVLYVVEELTPLFEQRLRANGYVLVHWGYAGWIHLFSKEPIRRIEDLKRQKLFVTAGDDFFVEWWNDHDFHPVPLAVTDIFQGLETGLIDVVPSPTIASLTFQWYRATPYMLDLPISPYLGATIVSADVWDKLSAGDRAAMLAAAKDIERHLAEEVPRREREAIEEMQRRKVTVTSAADDKNESPWRDMASMIGEKMRGERIDKECFDKVLALRDAFRAREAK